MRTTVVGLLTITLVGVSIFLGAQPACDRVKVRIRLVDDATGKGISGMVRVLGEDQKPIELPKLFDRMAGLTKDLPGVHWYVIPATGADTKLPKGKGQIHALSGLESALTKTNVEIAGNGAEEITIRMPRLFRAEEHSLVAGNTHLHLRGFSLEMADEYLTTIPAADGLRVMFISYLDRNKEDAAYITNKYPIGALPKFDATGVLFNNGQEHRHNFKEYGEGYGHVMFLNLKELVKPVSIGPGITGAGFDDRALRDGIDRARKQKATVIWCHNTFGFEDVLNALTGRLDALNVFDGSQAGKYEDNYYRYLNLGIKMPISTGTDWFLYDFSRVYAEVKGKLTIATWLDALKAGRCQATNGPLLTLNVDGKTPGEVIDLKDRKALKVQASAVGRYPLDRLQVVKNGKVIHSKNANPKDPRSIQVSFEVKIDEPAWFALRIESSAKSEFAKPIFAHTSPVYVTFKGKSVFEIDSAQALVKQIEEGQAAIKAHGTFSSDEARKKIQSLYEESAEILRARIEARQ